VLWPSKGTLREGERAVTLDAELGTGPVTSRISGIEEIEQFLYDEAALLDDWRLDAWVDLFAEDGRYEVPPTDAPEGESTRTLFLIADSRSRIEARVHRLNSKNAHAENPHSRTRHFISNIRARRSAETDELEVRSNFIVYRFRYEHPDTYVGHYLHVLRARDDHYQIVYKRATLDNEALRPMGLLSIIL
jgi:p-cumate 2,3-dioxygenase beta subunit